MQPLPSIDGCDRSAIAIIDQWVRSMMQPMPLIHGYDQWIAIIDRWVRSHRLIDCCIDWQQSMAGITIIDRWLAQLLERLPSIDGCNHIHRSIAAICQVQGRGCITFLQTELLTQKETNSFGWMIGTKKKYIIEIVCIRYFVLWSL